MSTELSRPLKPANRYLALIGGGFFVLAVLVFAFGPLFISLFGTLNDDNLFAIRVITVALSVVGVVAGLFAVAIGASAGSSKAERTFKYSVAAGLSSPIIIAGVLASPLDLVRYLASVGGTAVFVAVIIGALLKSDVNGALRDALELALIAIGTIGGVAALAGILINP